ncbi:hypothetical protein GP486_006172 [Trichoglossum hirsutum]|uniref:Uncharacterized protein n=1 Tax=Trichoglossum hirsutum TaxID=265104 RepID=A0A9P8L7V2_9PEZI|nr:hypothetical protein GP486_006172 [Trichoglossum hirsutum]
MSSANPSPAVLSDRDINTSAPKSDDGEPSAAGSKKALEYHRQMLQSKLKGEEYGTTTTTTTATASERLLAPPVGPAGCGFADGCGGSSAMPQYVSPSDGIMSPCTAKLSAYKSKHFMK